MARATWAEDRVAAWYVREGYEVIARNWRCPRGELDVVAWRDGVLVICEVKARRNSDFGDAFDAITPNKVLRLRRATAAFIATMHDDGSTVSCGGLRRPIRNVRFDAAAMLGGRVEVRESAF